MQPTEDGKSRRITIARLNFQSPDSGLRNLLSLDPVSELNVQFGHHFATLMHIISYYDV